MKYSHVFWDWNGTLLDDAAWCLAVIDDMLRRRGLRGLGSLEAYRSVFDFPIVDYYRKVGFDFDAEPFEALAEEYIALYHRDQTGGCGLMDGAESVLGAVRAGGAKQLILTASQRENLHSQLKPFAIAEYFEECLAIDDIYARSKVQIGRDYLENHPVARGVLIGDTLHDHEVAQALGLDCLLICRGHHGRERLESTGAPVLESLEGLFTELW